MDPIHDPLEWFAYSHLPDHLQEVSRKFSELVGTLCQQLAPGRERDKMIDKLIEAKDCAVRARLKPGK